MKNNEDTFLQNNHQSFSYNWMAYCWWKMVSFVGGQNLLVTHIFNRIYFIYSPTSEVSDFTLGVTAGQ